MYMYIYICICITNVETNFAGPLVYDFLGGPTKVQIPQPWILSQDHKNRQGIFRALLGLANLEMSYQSVA